MPRYYGDAAMRSRGRRPTGRSVPTYGNRTPSVSARRWALAISPKLFPTLENAFPTFHRRPSWSRSKIDGLDEASRTRIQRVAQAMGRFRSHQHIVTVFDLGKEQDQPNMVTELMAGGDVEGVTEDA